MILNTPVLQIYNQILYGNPAEKKNLFIYFFKTENTEFIYTNKIYFKKIIIITNLKKVIYFFIWIFLKMYYVEII